MSDIIINRTGRIFHRVDPTLIEIIKEIFPDAVAPLSHEPERIAAPLLKKLETVKWSVGTHHLSGEVIIQASDGRTELFYTGAAAHAHTFKLRGEAPPQEIIDEYARQKQEYIDPEALAERRYQSVLAAESARLKQSGTLK